MKNAKNKYVSNKIRVLKKEGRSIKEAVAIALSMWDKRKKYAEGGAVEGWGLQTNFSQDPSALQPTDVEEPDKPNEDLANLIQEAPSSEEETLGVTDNVEQAGMGGYDEAIMASERDALANTIVDAVPLFKMFKGIGEGVTNAIVGDSTGEERRSRQKLAAVFTSPHKLLAMREADKTGDYHYEEEEEEAEEIIPHAQTDFWAKNGVKIKKKSYDNGGLLEDLRQKRAERRIERTPVRDASSQEVLEMLASYGPDSPMMQGEYDPRAKEIVMYKDDPDTLKHEQIHASQYGPLQRLAKRMNDERSARIQDPVKRKIYRKLSEDISPEVFEGFNDAGKFIMDKGEEFEAVLDTGVNAAKEIGVDFTGSFDDIKTQLKAVQSPTNNMTGLIKFMENTFTDKQKDLILKALR